MGQGEMNKVIVVSLSFLLLGLSARFAAPPNPVAHCQGKVDLAMTPGCEEYGFSYYSKTTTTTTTTTTTPLNIVSDRTPPQSQGAIEEYDHWKMATAKKGREGGFGGTAKGMGTGGPSVDMS